MVLACAKWMSAKSLARAAHAGAGCELATCRLEIGLRALKPLNPRTHRNVAHRLRRRAQKAGLRLSADGGCLPLCPSGEKLTYRYTNEEDGKTLRRYWTTACPRCPLKSQCTKGPERRITRWEHEHLLEAVQQRLDENPQAGATHFLMKRLPKVATEMALHVLAYNLTRVMNIVGVQPLMAAIRA